MRCQASRGLLQEEGAVVPRKQPGGHGEPLKAADLFTAAAMKRGIGTRRGVAPREPSHRPRHAQRRGGDDEPDRRRALPADRPHAVAHPKLALRVIDKPQVFGVVHTRRVVQVGGPAAVARAIGLSHVGALAPPGREQLDHQHPQVKLDVGAVDGG